MQAKLLEGAGKYFRRKLIPWYSTQGPLLLFVCFCFFPFPFLEGGQGFVFLGLREFGV